MVQYDCSEHDFIEKELSRQTIIKIQSSLLKIRNESCVELKQTILKLKKDHDGFPSTEKEFRDEYRSLAKIFEAARVPKNVLDRIKSEKGYSGPNLESCIKIGLAIGCDNIKEIDEILSARGLVTLSNGDNQKYKEYRCVVKALLAEDELPPADRVNIFIKCTQAQ